MQIVSEWVSGYCLMPNKQFSAILWWEQAKFDKMMMTMLSALYQTNSLSRIFVQLAHWNNCPQVGMSLGNIILIPSQSVFALIP